MQRITIAKVLTFAAFTALALGISPTANAYDKGCSNATLKGTFAEKDTGFIVNTPPMPASLFAGVNLDTFDGKGTISATGFATVDGNGAPQAESGHYKVNPDCTGTYEVQIPPGGSFTAHAFFVIDDGGNELQIIVTDPGNVITCIARKQFPKREEPDRDDSRE